MNEWVRALMVVGWQGGKVRNGRWLVHLPLATYHNVHDGLHREPPADDARGGREDEGARGEAHALGHRVADLLRVPDAAVAAPAARADVRDLRACDTLVRIDRSIDRSIDTTTRTGHTKFAPNLVVDHDGLDLGLLDALPPHANGRPREGVAREGQRELVRRLLCVLIR